MVPYQEAQKHGAKNTRDLENILTDIIVLPNDYPSGTGAYA